MQMLSYIALSVSRAGAVWETSYGRHARAFRRETEYIIAPLSPIGHTDSRRFALLRFAMQLDCGIQCNLCVTFNINGRLTASTCPLFISNFSAIKRPRSTHAQLILGKEDPMNLKREPRLSSPSPKLSILMYESDDGEINRWTPNFPRQNDSEGDRAI